MEYSGIEWTGHTQNFWIGCVKVSPGCKSCYMFRDQRRFKLDPTRIRRTTDRMFTAPLRWKVPAMVFTCSWSDFFLEQADAWRDEAWDIIRRTPHLTWQILTKRPENILARLPHDWGMGWHHIWLGVSVEMAAYLWRVETLCQIPAALRFVSYEPALGPVDFTPYLQDIQWLISGGESGPVRRSADPAWFRTVRDQCRQFGVTYFHKQHGGSLKIEGSWGGHLLDGVAHRAWPQFPQDRTPRSAAQQLALFRVGTDGETC
jgi:protein gp37